MIKLLALSLALASGSAMAATAYFTGHKEIVTTVTHKRMWRCEYRYQGSTVYILTDLTDGCPSWIEIE